MKKDVKTMMAGQRGNPRIIGDRKDFSVKSGYWRIIEGTSANLADAPDWWI
jgi:hypothetical protein